MIINEDELLEDVIDGLSSYLERELTPDELKIAEEKIEPIIYKMLTAESDIILETAKKMKDR